MLGLPPNALLEARSWGEDTRHSELHLLSPWVRVPGIPGVPVPNTEWVLLVLRAAPSTPPA